jgi:hypothetical protein
MFRITSSLAGLIVVAILLFLASKGWIKGLRRELPPWRNALGVSALLLLLVNWIATAALEAPILVIPRNPRHAGLMEAMLTLSHPLGLVVVMLAVALKSIPRIQAIFAALLMLVCWPLGYV